MPMVGYTVRCAASVSPQTESSPTLPHTAPPFPSTHACPPADRTAPDPDGAAWAALHAHARDASERAPLAHLVVEHDGHESRVTDADSRAHQLLGRPDGALVGRCLEELAHWQDRRVQTDVLHEILAQAPRHGEWRLVRGDGSVVWCRVSGSAVPDAPEAPRAVLVLDDVTEHKRQEEALRAAHAALDAAVVGIVQVDLSGISRTANQYAARATGHAQADLVGLPWTAIVHPDDHAALERGLAEATGDEPASVEVRGLRADGSWFDETVVVSPSHGGDGALTGHFLFFRDVSERRSTQRALEAGEARYQPLVETADDRRGGAAFLLVSEELADTRAATACAQRIPAALREPFTLPVGTVGVTASVGIAVADADGTRAEELFAPAMRGDFREELSLEQDLRHAVRSGALDLHFQPKLTLPDERVVGFEALVRWDHPSRGPVPATAFIAIAERSDLIVPLGRWVLTEACRQVRRWGDHEWARVAVNVSARELEQTGFVERVAEILDETGAPAERIELEITETLLFARTLPRRRPPSSAWRTSACGSSSTTSEPVLVPQPPRPLPAGRAEARSLFVSGCTSADGTERPIVEAVTAMAQALGLTLVGEGVETVEQGLLLASLGCDQVQGHLFSPPMPADAVESWIAARPKQLFAVASPIAPGTAAGWIGLGEAATALGVSASTLRRWTDEGRITVQRTQGGHRRFHVADLKRLGPAASRPRLNLCGAPAGTTPRLAAVLEVHGPQIVERVVGRMYNGPTRGWFADDRARGAVARWLGALAAACRTPDFEAARRDTVALVRTAEVGGASLLECETFVSRIGATTLQVLQLDAGADRDELQDAQASWRPCATRCQGR